MFVVFVFGVTFFHFNDSKYNIIIENNKFFIYVVSFIVIFFQRKWPFYIIVSFHFLLLSLSLSLSLMNLSLYEGSLNNKWTKNKQK